MFNVLSLAYADSSPICWHGIRHGTLVARGHSGWAAGCGMNTLCKQEALMAVRHLLAVQHLSLLLQWGSLQSMGCDGKPSLTCHHGSQRRPHSLSSPLADGARTGVQDMAKWKLSQENKLLSKWSKNKPSVLPWLQPLAAVDLSDHFCKVTQLVWVSAHTPNLVS